MSRMTNQHPMDEKAARARMVAEITATVQSKSATLISITRVHRALGHAPVKIHGESDGFQVGSEFRKDWTAGVTLREMSKKYGVSTSVISKWASSAGLPSRQGGRQHLVTVGPEFRRAWQAGVSTKKMAAALGVSIFSIYSAARAAGLPSRPMGNPNFRKGDNQ